MARSRFALPVALTASLLWTAHAEASGFATARFGGEYGYPLTNNPTAVYYNPAGLAGAEGYHLFVDGNFAWRRASYDHNPGATDQSDCVEPHAGEIADIAEQCNAANNGKTSLSNVLASPMIGLSAELAPHLVVGAGFYVPLGGISIWDKNDAFKDNQRFAGPYDGSNRWYSINGTIKSTYMTAALGYEIPRTGLSLGLSVSAIESVVDTLRARTASGTSDIVLEGRSYVDVSGWQLGFGAGAIWEIKKDRFWVGASYQSRPNISGGMILKGTIKTRLPPGATTEGPVSLEQDLPDIIRAGIRVRPNPALEVRLFGDITRWSALKNQCIAEGGTNCKVDGLGGSVPGTDTSQNLPRDWNDAFAVRAGASYWANPDVEFMLGSGYDSNAIPDESLDPALMDFDDVSVALGGRFHVVEPLFVAVTATHFFYFSRDTTGKSKTADWNVPSRSPDSGGKYTQAIDVLNVNLEAVF